MNTHRKSMSYSAFMALTPEERAAQSSLLLQKNADKCPVILTIRHQGKQIDIKNCKYLINRQSIFSLELGKLREYVIKYSQGQITSKSALFFAHNFKMIDTNQKVSSFLSSHFKDLHKDGWLHLIVTTEDTF